MGSAPGEGENAASGDPVEARAGIVSMDPGKRRPGPRLRNVLLESGLEAVRSIPPRLPSDRPKKACEKRAYGGTCLVGRNINATRRRECCGRHVMVNGEPWTPEQVADFLREVGMRHVGENQWIGEELSLGTLRSSEYEVAEALT